MTGWAMFGTPKQQVNWNLLVPEPVTYLWPAPSKAPHTCPVCNGRGDMPKGFYETELCPQVTACTVSAMCRSCNGKGVLWGP